MPIALRALLAALLLAGGALYLAYVVLWLRVMRGQANVQRGYDRALLRFPEAVRRDNQAALVRRALALAAAFLGTLLVSGVISMITTNPAALAAGPIIVAFLLLALSAVYSSAVVGLDMLRRFAGWPDPGITLLDLGCGWHGTAASRNAAFFGMGAFAYAVLCLVGGNVTASLVWSVIALLALGRSAAGVGRIELTERGLWKAPQFWRWGRFVRHAWSDDGSCVALRLATGLHRVPWVLVPVPEGQREAVETILARVVPDADGASHTPTA